MAGMSPRAASRPSRTGEAPSRDQLVVLVAIAVLALTALIVIVGIFLTWYRPPRATALTVDGSAVTAVQVQHRLQYLMFFESADVGTDQTQLVSKTLDRMERDEIVRRRAPAVVGDIDAEAVTQHLRKELGPQAPPQITTNNPDITATNPDATPVPLSDEEYAKALQERLKTAAISKDELDTIARTEVLEEKLREKFRAELPKSGPQVHLVVARTNDKPKAEQVRSIGLRPGVEFVPVASLNSASGGGATGDVGWVLPESLSGPARDAVKQLKPGEFTPVLQNGLYFEVYKLVETNDSKEYETKQLDTLVDEKFKAWVEQERANVKFERVLSTETDEWIRDQAIAAFRAGQPGG